MHGRVNVLEERADTLRRQRPRANKPTDERITQARRNAQGDVLPVDYSTYTIAPAPEFTKDRDYKHGALPSVPKHQLHFTRY